MRQFRIIVTALLNVIVCSLSFSQTGYYHKVITSTQELASRSTIRTCDNSYYIIGKTGNQSGFLMKTDSLSNVLWCKSYANQSGSFQETRWTQIVETKDSNLMICGGIYDFGTGKEDGLYLKLDLNGDTLWSKKITVPVGSLQLSSVCLSPEGGYAFAGTIKEASPSITNHFFAMSTDSLGNLLWSNQYTAGNTSSYSKFIYSTPDSGLMFIGYVESFSPFDAGAALFKLDPNGSIDWSFKYANGIGNITVGEDLTLLPDGPILELSVFSATVLLKLDWIGNVVRDTSFVMSTTAGYLYKYNSRIKKLSNDQLVLINGEDFTTTVVKLDTAFQIIWSDALPMRTYDFFETPAGDLHFVGGGPLWGVVQNTPDGIIDLELGIVHTDSLGTVGGCNYLTFVGGTNTTITKTILASQRITTGSTSLISLVATPQSTFSMDTCVTFTGGVTESILFPLELYPNPSSGVFKIDMPLKEKGKITIRNYRSEEIFSTNTSNESITIDLSKQPNGIYFCQWQNNKGRMFHGKIVISK